MMTVKAAKPDALIISETWQKDSTLLRMLRGDRADTTMNYRLRDAVIGLLALWERTGEFDIGDAARTIAKVVTHNCWQVGLGGLEQKRRMANPGDHHVAGRRCCGRSRRREGDRLGPQPGPLSTELPAQEIPDPPRVAVVGLEEGFPVEVIGARRCHRGEMNGNSRRAQTEAETCA